MTDSEITLAHELWADGMSSKQIARVLLYPHSTVRSMMSVKRDLFPARRFEHVEADVAKKGMWLARIDAKRATPEQAARALGVNVQAVYWWLIQERRLHEPNATGKA